MKGLKQIDDFIITRELSKEKEIILYEAVNKKTNAIVVIKAFPTDLFKDKRKLDFFKSELKLISGFDHPNIIKFYSLKKTEKFYYLIMEYCNGRQLSAYKAYYEKANKSPLKEHLIQKLLKEILSGLSYMHNCNTIHRNLSLENIEINFNSISNKVKANQNPEDIDYSKVSLLECTAKISNLSFARELDENGVASTVVGSPIFMAPDIIVNALQPQKKEFYSANVDLWSLGAITYELLVGRPPFDGNDIATVSKKLNEGSYSFPLELNLSIEAMTFIDGLIQFSPEKRMKWEELMSHSFISNAISTFHYLEKDGLKAGKISKELVLNINKNNSQLIWSKEKKPQLSQAQSSKAMEKEIEKAKAIEDELYREIQLKKKTLEKEMVKIEKEKQQTGEKLLKAERDKREAEELKKRTELEKTRLTNYEKNQKELNEETLRKEKERKSKEEMLRLQEKDKLNKEKERINEEKKRTEQLKAEVESILKNAEKMKLEAEDQKKTILKAKEVEEQQKREEEHKRQMKEQDTDSSKTKLIQELKQKEDQHSIEILKLQKDLLSLKAFSYELKTEALEKKQVMKILEEKETEKKRLQSEIEQIINEKEEEIIKIQRETEEKELLIAQEKKRREKEELERKRLEEKGQEEANLNRNELNVHNPLGLGISVMPSFDAEWECYSTKSVELDKNIDVSDFVILSEYVSTKANI